MNLNVLRDIIKNSVIWIHEALWIGSVYMRPEQLMFLQDFAALLARFSYSLRRGADVASFFSPISTCSKARDRFRSFAC